LPLGRLVQVSGNGQVLPDTPHISSTTPSDGGRRSPPKSRWVAALRRSHRKFPPLCIRGSVASGPKVPCRWPGGVRRLRFTSIKL
jgi:hypothetical protein